MANFLNSWSIVSSSGFQAKRSQSSKAETVSAEKARQGEVQMACM